MAGSGGGVFAQQQSDCTVEEHGVFVKNGLVPHGSAPDGHASAAVGSADGSCAPSSQQQSCCNVAEHGTVWKLVGPHG